MRVQDARGFRVVKVCDDGGTIYRSEDDRTIPPPPPARPKAEASQPADFNAIWSRCFNACTMQMADDLASELGLRKGITLSLVGLGWHPELESWVFPMYAPDLETVVGLRTRDREGNKRAIRGSKQGLFGYPTVLDGCTELLVCEGPTDTAAAIEMGFQAVGRPSCTGAADMIREISENRNVVIVSDADEPGRKGADSLAKKLHRFARSTKIVRPPAKDMRDWYADGAGRSAMRFLIDNASMCHA